MLTMQKNEHEAKLFNTERFQTLWAVSKDQAMEYKAECDAYRQEYLKAHSKVQTVEKVDDEKPIIEEKTEQSEDEVKEWLVKILRDNGMKLASTKWSLETLTKKVAELNQSK